MKDRETARMRKYGESKTTRIMMATVPNVTSGSGFKKFQADGFLFDRVYKRSGQPTSYILNGQTDCLTLNVGPIGRTETSIASSKRSEGGTDRPYRNVDSYQ